MSRSSARIKAPALVSAVPQSRDECARDIRIIGDLQRDLTRQRTTMNDQIAEHTQFHQPVIDGLQQRIIAVSVGVQTWCEAHRSELLKGDAKTANLVTGEVAWRSRPPSVLIRGMDIVIETLKRLGLGRFVRTKEEVNKEAVLADPRAVAGVAGISVTTGVEDFIISPFEQDVP